MPAGWTDDLRASYGGYSSRELLRDPQGPFGGFSRLPEVQRDGRTFVLLHRGGPPEWSLEVEVRDDGLGALIARSPEENWAMARESDAAQNPPIELDPLDAAKLF